MTREQTLRNTDIEARNVCGATNTSGREYIMKAPSFSGDHKGDDFYTFEKDWKEFAVQKHVSNAQLLRILLKESLSGPAQRTCRDMKTIDEVFVRLKRMYGNPRVLISAKMDEISKLKRCELLLLWAEQMPWGVWLVYFLDDRRPQLVSKSIMYTAYAYFTRTNLKS